MTVGKRKIALVACVLISLFFLSNSSKYVLREEPSQVKVILGQPAVLKCRLDIPENVVKIKLQWSKDMFGLENSTIQDVYKGRLIVSGSIQSGNYDLHFKTTEAQDEALYACHIELTFRDNEIVESVIGKGSLKVIEPPTELKFQFRVANASDSGIIWQRRNSILWVLENQKLSFTCISKNGNPMPKLMWSVKTETGLNDNESLQRQNYNSIDLSSDFHNSNISCKVVNKKDYLDWKLPTAVVSVQVLYIKNADILRTNGFLDKPIHNGEAVSFSCNSVYTPGIVISYSWFVEYNNAEKHNGEYLVERSSSNNIVIKASPKFHFSRLRCIIFTSVLKENCDSNTNRNCNIELRHETVSSKSLNILYPPKIKTPFENITVSNIGEWVVLSCEVDSNPQASIRWYKTHFGTSRNTRSINWYYQTSTINLNEVTLIENLISSTSYHKFQIVNEYDLDIYICEAQAYTFQKIYKYVVVAKKEEPSIKVEQTTIKAENDGIASLMCLIESWPKPSPSNIKWYFETSALSIVSTERRFVINKRQLMGVESKLFFKKVIHSDYGTYTCSFSYGQTIVSKQIHLLPLRSKFVIFISIGSLGALLLLIIIIAVICACKKGASKKRKSKKNIPRPTKGLQSAPLQTIMLPSPTIGSSIDNEIFINRINSIPGYQKENGLNESIVLPSNRCFVFRNQPNIQKLSFSGDSRNGQDDKSTTKGNESNRSWDSGVGADDAVYRNGQPFQNIRGSNIISPFSTLTSSNNSIGPVNIPNRYWQSYHPIELITQQNPETSSSRLSNTETSNFNGSNHSSFLPPQDETHIPMIATSANQSFVCIPIEEYQHHMRILQESQGPPSLRSFSIGSYSTNNGGNSTFHPNYRTQNGNVSPTDVSVKSASTNSKM